MDDRLLTEFWQQRESLTNAQLLEMAERWSKHIDDEAAGVLEDYDVDQEIVHEDFPRLMSCVACLHGKLAEADALEMTAWRAAKLLRRYQPSMAGELEQATAEYRAACQEQADDA